MMQAQASVVYSDFSTALLSSTSSWAIIHVRVLRQEEPQHAY